MDSRKKLNFYAQGQCYGGYLKFPDVARVDLDLQNRQIPDARRRIFRSIDND